MLNIGLNSKFYIFVEISQHFQRKLAISQHVSRAYFVPKAVTTQCTTQGTTLGTTPGTTPGTWKCTFQLGYNVKHFIETLQGIFQCAQRS